MVVIIAAAFMVQTGGLPVDVPLWQLLLVGALIWFALTNDELPFDPPQLPDPIPDQGSDGAESDTGILPPLPEESEPAAGPVDLLADDFKEEQIDSEEEVRFVLDEDVEEN